MLYAKHLLLMTLALWLVPVCARAFAAWNGGHYRLVRPGIRFLWLIGRLAIAVVIPLLAEGGFELLSAEWPRAWFVRYVALAFAGACYGATFGDREDYPPISTAIWGAAGGALTAYLFGYGPSTDLYRAFCVAVFAVLPLGAYEPIRQGVREKLQAFGEIVPSRRVLR